MEKKKKILVVGSGGREASILWKLAQSAAVGELHCAPGNAGMADLAVCHDVKATNLEGLVNLAQELAVDLVFVAPDDPLAMGLVDRLEAAGIAAFGPSAAAARIEASKAYAKELMRAKSIPTADFATFSTAEDALLYCENAKHPLVVKADGLALGKGVLICQTQEESQAAIKALMLDNHFGEAGRTVVVEEFLSGEELTLLCFTDGEHYKLMLPTRDHKRALDGNKGLNTGGMGAVCPSYFMRDEELDYIEKRIVRPTLEALREAGTPFKGVLYFGLMMTCDGAKVIEYNARFGDPETQPLLTLLRTDLLDIIYHILENRLDQLSLEWESMCAACVVLSAGGYPEQYEKGHLIHGMEKYPFTRESAMLSGQARGETLKLVVPAGVALNQDGALVSSGGRVLALTCRAKSMEEALDSCYRMAEEVYFSKMHYRKDIGRS